MVPPASRCNGLAVVGSPPAPRIFLRSSGRRIGLAQASGIQKTRPGEGQKVQMPASWRRNERGIRPAASPTVFVTIVCEAGANAPPAVLPVLRWPGATRGLAHPGTVVDRLHGAAGGPGPRMRPGSASRCLRPASATGSARTGGSRWPLHDGPEPAGAGTVRGEEPRRLRDGPGRIGVVRGGNGGSEVQSRAKGACGSLAGLRWAGELPAPRG